MSDDIEKVKIATKNILHEAKDSNCVPRKYVLVTFSDQANLTTIKSTTDFQIMLTWLDEITVRGGDGCAEYAMTGILKGIEMSNNDSSMVKDDTEGRTSSTLLQGRQNRHHGNGTKGLPVHAERAAP